jgi:hypothetical protein
MYFGRDLVYGGLGDDVIWGHGGADTLYGDVDSDPNSTIGGNDQIFGSVPAPFNVDDTPDQIFAGGGNDFAFGQGGNDNIDGAAGNDTICGGTGSDLILGGWGDDVIYGATPTTHQSLPTITVNFDGTTDAAITPIQAGGIDGDLAPDDSTPDTLLGGFGNDFIVGSQGGDYIEGNADNDTVFGGGGNDTILGGTGADAVDGGRGNDFLTGDAGLDVFHFANGYGADIVTDFTPGTDKLDLTGMGLTSTLQALAFASQVGSDTVFNFGAGDTITLQNVSNAALTSEDIITGGFSRTTLALGQFGASNAAGGWGSNNVFPRELADVNGDGMADIVGVGNAGVTVALATGAGNFGPSSLRSGEFGVLNSAGGWSSNDLFPRLMADVNGDHMADIVGFGNAGVIVALATGSGGFGPSSLRSSEFGASNSAGGWNSNNIYHREMGDVNGDGLADVVGFGIAGVSVALSVGAGNFGSAQLLSTEFGSSNASGGWISQDLFPRAVADVDGDGGH